MKMYTTDGVTVTNGEGHMGIFSTVELLNQKIGEISKLEHALANKEQSLKLTKDALELMKKKNEELEIKANEQRLKIKRFEDQIKDLESERLLLHRSLERSRVKS